MTWELEKEMAGVSLCVQLIKMTERSSIIVIANLLYRLSLHVNILTPGGLILQKILFYLTVFCSNYYCNITVISSRHIALSLQIIADPKTNLIQSIVPPTNGKFCLSHSDWYFHPQNRHEQNMIALTKTVETHSQSVAITAISAC